jgi:hypothetical protein
MPFSVSCLRNCEEDLTIHIKTCNEFILGSFVTYLRGQEMQDLLTFIYETKQVNKNNSLTHIF